MNRNISLVSVLFAGSIALGSLAAHAAPVKDVKAHSAATSPTSQVRKNDSKPAPRVQAQKAPPKYYPPGPTGHDAPPSS